MDIRIKEIKKILDGYNAISCRKGQGRTAH